MHMQVNAAKRIPLGPIALLLFVLCALPLLGLARIALEHKRVAGYFAVGEAYYMPPPRALRALCFGYNELAADIVWLRTIAYFADHLRGDHDFTHLDKYLRTILALDPHFREIYRYGAAMLLSGGSQQTNADVFNAIELSERAHKLFPDDWQYPLSLGTYYLAELKTKSPEKRSSWRRTAAEWIRRAALIGATVPWLGTLAAKIYTEQGERELAIRHLKELYMISPDEQIRTQIAAKLKALEDKQVEQLRSSFDRFAERHRASELRFVPPDLYAVVRLDPLPPFSLEALAPDQAQPDE